MTPPTTPDLNSLEFFSYLNADGLVPKEHQNKIGVYAIFDNNKMLQFIGYSRDIYLSLRQHLVRQPQHCYWFKVFLIERPNRTILEEIRQQWLRENGSIPEGNKSDLSRWTQAIDIKAMMSDSEQEEYQSIEVGQDKKFLKQIARRVESEILETLQARGARMQLRFNPKLKEKGLLDLK